MEIKPGETGSMKLAIGEETIINHNRPALYQVVTSGGSVIEVELPGGVDFKIKNEGDIASIKLILFDAPSGPTEIV